MKPTLVRVKESELKAIRFGDGLKIRLGSQVLEYPSDLMFYNNLCLLSKDENNAYAFYTHAVVTDAMNDTQTWKTFAQQFEETMNIFKIISRPFVGVVMKVAYQKEPPLTTVMYDLQDALCYAISDYPNADPDDVFANFIGGLGCPWWVKITGTDKAMKLCQKFFDVFYSEYCSILKKHDTREH